MAIQLGMNSKMYYNDTANAGTVLVPVWVEIGKATGRKFDLSKATADTTTFDNNGWESETGTLKKGAVDFDMLWDTEDAAFAFVQNAWMNNINIEMLILDRDKDTAGAEGLHSGFAVNDMSQDASLKDAIKASIKLAVSTLTGVSTFWQRTYTTAVGFTPAVGAACYYNSTAGTVSATDTDTYVGDAVYAAVAEAPVMVDVNATE